MISPVIVMLFVLGLFVWMLARPRTTVAPRVLLFLVAVVIFGPISVWVMDWETTAFPLKFDYYLYELDRALGPSAFWIARFLSTRARDILFVVYETLGYWMIFWYAINLRTGKKQGQQVVTAYAVAYGLAPLFYLIVPACGPRHAFGSIFPAGAPDVSLVRIPLAYWPNAIPSLHIATAILFVYFAGRSVVWRSLAWVYLAGTAAATLAFEHYTIDLVVGVPYALFAVCVAIGKWRLAVRNVALVLVWLAAIRFAAPALVRYPLLLQAASLATLAAGVWGRHSWRFRRSLSPAPGVPDCEPAPQVTGR